MKNSKANKILKGFKKSVLALYSMAFVFAMSSITSFAASAAPSGAEGKWDAAIGFITPWITRLGGAVMLIGAVEFGLAFKNDDAEGKTKGMRTLIAGAIVIAVGLSSGTFLY